jgi:hypothetical protein
MRAIFSCFSIPRQARSVTPQVFGFSWFRSPERGKKALAPKPISPSLFRVQTKSAPVNRLTGEGWN